MSVSFNIRRQNVESSALNLQRIFDHNSSQKKSCSFFVSCDFLRQLQFLSHHLPRSATRTFPDRRFTSITQCLSCGIFASHNSTLGDAQNCSCSIMMTSKDPLSHAACNRTDTVFSNVTKPNFLFKLRQWPSPSSTSSSHFTRLSVFANSHSVHELRWKTRKPIVRWTVICDTHTCISFSGNTESSAFSFHLSHSHFHTRANHRFSKRFHTRIILAFQNDSAKIKIRDETDKKWDEVCCGTFPFTTHICCLDKSELEMCLHSLVSRNRNKKLTLRLFFLFLLSPTVQFDVVSQHHDLRHKQPTNSCKQHVHNPFFLT